MSSNHLLSASLRLRSFALLFLLAAIAGCQSDQTGPVTVPTETRGTVIWSRLVQTMSQDFMTGELQTISPLLSAENDAEVYRIVYETIDEHGAKTQASGTIVIPTGLFEAVPIVSYQHGTIVTKASVPYFNGYQYSFEHLVGVGFGGNGYIAVYPDYLGLGDSPQLHPYVHANSLASAVIDMLRATRHFIKTKAVKWNEQIFLVGYSEGGFATMAAQREIETSLASEIKLTASAPMAGPYDMSGSMRELMLSSEPYVHPLFLPYTVYSYVRAYGAFDLDDIFKPEFANIVPELFDGLHGFSAVDAAFPEIPREMFTYEFLTAFEDPEHPLRKALAANDIYKWKPSTLTRLYHCSGDEQVPYRNSEVAMSHFTQVGGNATLVTTSNEMHDPCGERSLIYAKLWFDQLKK